MTTLLPTPSTMRNRLAACLLLALMTLVPCLCSAQAPGLTEGQIKAGFLFNFIRFVEWPPAAFESPSSPITICMLGETKIDSLLLEATKSKAIDGRAIAVKHVRATQALHTCHLLFIASSDAAKGASILGKLALANTLTVGDSPGFAQTGGVLDFITEDNRVKLELNLGAATRADLKISAKLIAVSRLVHDQHAAEGN